LESLAEIAASASVRVHAYVRMTNHVHLLLTPATELGAAMLMKGLGQRYVQYVNRTYRRTETLFEGRFRSSLIEADSYLLACQRYIEINPVRAHVVLAPEDYPWSSYRCNALGAADPVITPHPSTWPLPRAAKRDAPTIAAYSPRRFRRRSLRRFGERPTGALPWAVIVSNGRSRPWSAGAPGPVSPGGRRNRSRTTSS
jgi:REP element-mobilizing transposase RayT